MWKFLGYLISNSQVLRAVAIALVALFAKIAIYYGVGEEEFTKQAMDIVDVSLTFIAALSTVWAGYARIAHPNPPLSQKAVTKTAQMVQEGKLEAVHVGKYPDVVNVAPPTSEVNENVEKVKLKVKAKAKGKKNA